MAIALFEPMSGVFRVLEDDKPDYGDKFHWASFVRFLNRHEIEICAYMDEIKPSIRKAIYRRCQEMGVTRILGVNYPDGADGERKERWFDVPPKRDRDLQQP